MIKRICLCQEYYLQLLEMKLLLQIKIASNYVFEGIKICNKAFLIIYGIGKKYWNNI